MVSKQRIKWLTQEKTTDRLHYAAAQSIDQTSGNRKIAKMVINV